MPNELEVINELKEWIEEQKNYMSSCAKEEKNKNGRSLDYEYYKGRKNAYKDALLKIQSLKNKYIKRRLKRKDNKEKFISIEVYKQVMWERDIALEQLNELGLSFGQKIDGVYLSKKEYENLKAEAIKEFCDEINEKMQGPEGEKFILK